MSIGSKSSKNVQREKKARKRGEKQTSEDRISYKNNGEKASKREIETELERRGIVITWKAVSR